MDSDVSGLISQSEPSDYQAEYYMRKTESHASWYGNVNWASDAAIGGGQAGEFSGPLHDEHERQEELEALKTEIKESGVRESDEAIEQLISRLERMSTTLEARFLAEGEASTNLTTLLWRLRIPLPTDEQDEAKFGQFAKTVVQEVLAEAKQFFNHKDTPLRDTVSQLNEFLRDGDISRRQERWRIEVLDRAARKAKSMNRCGAVLKSFKSPADCLWECAEIQDYSVVEIFRIKPKVCELASSFDLHDALEASYGTLDSKYMWQLFKELVQLKNAYKEEKRFGSEYFPNNREMLLAVAEQEDISLNTLAFFFMTRDKPIKFKELNYFIADQLLVENRPATGLVSEAIKRGVWDRSAKVAAWDQEGNQISLLWQAIESGSDEQVKALIENEANFVNETHEIDDEIDTMIGKHNQLNPTDIDLKRHAIINGRSGIIKLLEEKTGQKCSVGMRLLYAPDSSWLDGIDWAAVQPEDWDEDLIRALAIIVSNGDMPFLSDLFDKGLPTSCCRQDSYINWTEYNYLKDYFPIASADSSSVVRLFVDSGARLADYGKFSPAREHIAAVQLELLDLLISVCRDEEDSSFLETFAPRELVESLYCRMIQESLHEFNGFDSISHVVERYGLANYQTVDGNTALLLQAKNDFDLGLEQAVGVDLDMTDAAGRTALMEAALRNNQNLIENLIARGANPTLKDGEGKTAADIAESMGRKILAGHLREDEQRWREKSSTESDENKLTY